MNRSALACGDGDIERPNLSDRRKIGAFYTPEALSTILARWAIRNQNDTVLEPSFGGCGLLAAARDVLIELGAKHPVEQIFGADIDRLAFDYLSSVFGSPTDTMGFIHRDFLECQDVAEWPHKFTTILANPPYIPYQNISGDKLAWLKANPGAIKGVRGRASLWAYFLSHALSHLGEGGRMAWVLPGAFLQADYAKPIRAYLEARFDRCAAIIMHERLFLNEGADEETVILLADGFCSSTSSGAIELGAAATIDELDQRISDWDRGEWRGRTSSSNPAALSLSETDIAAIGMCADNPNNCQLGSICKVQVGLVTGDNSYFVLNADALKANGLHSKDCTLVLSKFRAAPSMQLAKDDLLRYAKIGGKAYLVDSRDKLPNARLQRYLDLFGEERQATVSTFKKRRVWSETSDGNIPDAFFPVMHHNGPRIVLNDSKAHCTNTIHRVFFHEGVSRKKKMLAAISVLTSYSQVSAELVGRRYGSGVLKHEPRDAERISLLMPEVDETDLAKQFNAIERLLRKGAHRDASIAADNFIFSAANIDAKISATLSKVLTEIRLRRRPKTRSRKTS